MKLTATIELPQLTPSASFGLNLDIASFDPAAVFGKGWDFEVEEGVDDTVTGFVETLVKAVALLPSQKQEALELLFPTGIYKRQRYITGIERSAVLANRRFGDPYLGWSLVNEESQTTLNFLHRIFDISWMEFPNRYLLSPKRNRFAFYLYRPVNGPWACNVLFIGSPRFTQNPALSLIS